jgi:hypothetical protein
MARVISIWVGGLVAAGLKVAAMWLWRFAPELAAQNTDRPYVAKLGIRSLAVALGSAAQVVLFWCVIARVYPPRFVDRLLGFGIAIASFAALGTAVVLAVSSVR